MRRGLGFENGRNNLPLILIKILCFDRNVNAVLDCTCITDVLHHYYKMPFFFNENYFLSFRGHLRVNIRRVNKHIPVIGENGNEEISLVTTEVLINKTHKKLSG